MVRDEKNLLVTRVNTLRACFANEDSRARARARGARGGESFACARVRTNLRDFLNFISRHSPIDLVQWYLIFHKCASATVHQSGARAGSDQIGSDGTRNGTEE